jgi:hypothetical protein
MKNLKFKVAALFSVGLLLGSCIEHEVIPAPIPTVDLKCSFVGTINGTGVELTQNVQGFNCLTDKTKYLLPSPALSSAVYYSEMASSQTLLSIKVGMGSVMWDAASVADPTLPIFNDFFLNNMTPAYSNNSANGIEIQYRDSNGKIWVSKENSVNLQNAIFSNIKQESDANGDYNMYTLNFGCYVYHYDIGLDELDSVRIQNAVLKAWFKR